MTTAEAEAPAKTVREWTVMKQNEMRIKREAAGLSRSHVALTLGVSVGAIQNWEGGNSTPTTEHQQKMLDLFSNPPTVEAAASAAAGGEQPAGGTEPASKPARKGRAPKAKQPKAPKVKAAKAPKKARVAQAPKPESAGPANPLAVALRFERPAGDALASATAAVTAALVSAGKIKVGDVAETIRTIRAALMG